MAKGEMKSGMRIGAKCTVSHHYGHTDTEKVMKILSFEYKTGSQSGMAVTVDKLKWPVDSGLINVIPKKPHWKTRAKIEREEDYRRHLEKEENEYREFLTRDVGI